MAQTEDRVRGSIDIHRSYAASPGVVGSMVTPEDHLRYAAEAEAALPDLVEEAGITYDQHVALETADQAYPSAANVLRTAIEGQTVGRKVETIQASLGAIEAERTAEESLTEERSQQLRAQQEADLQVLSEVARRHPGIVPGLYYRSLREYVGHELLQGRPLEDIRAQHRANVSAGDTVGQQFATLEQLYRGLNISSSSEDAAWATVLETFDGTDGTPGERGVRALARGESYIDLGDAEAGLTHLLQDPTFFDDDDENRRRAGRS